MSSSLEHIYIGAGQLTIDRMISMLKSFEKRDSLNDINHKIAFRDCRSCIETLCEKVIELECRIWKQRVDQANRYIDLFLNKSQKLNIMLIYNCVGEVVDNRGKSATKWVLVWSVVRKKCQDKLKEYTLVLGKDNNGY